MGVDREARGYAQSQMDGCQWAVKSSRVQTHTASACMDTKILEYGKASTRNPYGARPRYAGVIPVGIRPSGRNYQRPEVLRLPHG